VGESLKLSVRSSFAAVAPANEEASAWLRARHVPADVVHVANLTVEELVTNCVRYAYADDSEHVVEVEMVLEEDRLLVHVVDDGHRFDPLTAPEPDLTLPLEERPIGGLGLHLLRQMADAMTYERVAGRNHVTVVKRLHAGDSAP
jgi:anti-sigma regulatory factor (Ser/Thr protein kinase)